MQIKPINEMNLEELAEYAVTLDGWERVPGMVLSHNWGRVIAVDGQRFRTADGWWERGNTYCYPDLTDPATLGCVLAMVRKKYGDSAHTYLDPHHGWMAIWWMQPVEGRHPMRTLHGRSEAHALIAALAKEAE